MPLTIIKGPPNSGRTEEIRREYIALLPRRPILVVPGIDDIFDWQRRLAREDGAFLGSRIMHFKDLVEEVLADEPETGHRLASLLERRHLVSSAFAEAWPGMKSRIERQPGLVDSMLQLIDEFRQALVSPDTLAEKLAEIDSGYTRSIISVYRHYVDSMEGLGLTDGPARAMSANAVGLEKWQGRPVYLAGFDDLTEQQLELIVRLGKQTDVTVALTHEIGNPAMAVTERLLGMLENRGATVRLSTERDLGTEPEQLAHDPLLLEVERDFMRQATPRSLEPGEAVSVMHSSGHRGEAEAVAERIANLVATGTDPGEIAVAIPGPAQNGGRFRDVLCEYDIPVTLESETPAVATAVGRSVLALLAAASATGTAADFIRYLRGPAGQDPDEVDWLEYVTVRAGTETASEAAAMLMGRDNRPPPGWKALVDGKGPPAEVVSKVCEALAENVLAADRSSMPSDRTVTEVQTAQAIAQACEELQSIDRNISAAEIADAIRSGAIKTWAIPSHGSVRIASPYSLRAKRFEHLFMVSLQENAFAQDRSGPFLDSDVRATAGLAEFMDAELQELYLFYSCLSVPTAGLWLSCRIADEAGKAEHPSPLIGAVESLFPEKSLRRHGRTAEAIVIDPGSAPSRSELARALAARPDPLAELDTRELGLAPQDSENLGSRLRAAREIEGSTRVLASLTVDAARDELAGLHTFSATALETFQVCPYKWFIERALRPQRFGPEPEPMANGSLIHAVLSELYDDHSGIPEPGNLNEWLAAVAPAVEKHAEEAGLGSGLAAHRVLRRQAIGAISRYLEGEALRENPRFLPLKTEARFGLEKDDEGADMGGWSLRGSIDRIDVSGEDGVGLGQRGIVIDYKTGKSGVMGFEKFRTAGKLQIQLYLKVLRQKFGITPVGGFYVPIVRSGAKSEGLIDKASKPDFADLNCKSTSFADDFEKEIDDGLAAATQAVEKIRRGEIDHDPLKCVDHFNHAAVPDWLPELEEETNWGSG